jgi:ubiquinone/menaquinone biosynthesis C-methylase UbiE
MLPAPMSDPGRLKPTTRFADRVADYVRFRPSYPPEVIRTLHDELGLRAGQAVADVGSGTGILSRLLVDHGNVVYGVEPSAEMAEAALAALGRTGRFHDVRGTAEETSLPSASADLATAAQAFHWFKVDAAREEFRRILRPPRPVAVVWNLRRTDTTPFLREYEAFLQEWGTDYKDVAVRYAEPTALARFFGGARYAARRFEYVQVFDREGVRGRLLSSSYAPGPGHPRHQGMLDALDRIFDRHARGGRLPFEYDTELYFGTLE